MTAVIVESSVMIVLMAGFRKFCRNLISMRLMYALWLIVVFSMLPYKWIFWGNAHSVILIIFSRLISLLPNCEFARFDFLAIRLPWYLCVLWGMGSAIVLLWEFLINFKFEKILYEKRVRIRNRTCPYPVYYVPNLSSSCIFKVKGEKGIYLQKEMLENEEVYRTILSHEICHLRAKDLFWTKLRLLFVAFYWFNPFVWVAAFLSKQDCEMSCDERTIALLKMNKFNYGDVLLSSVNTERMRAKDEVLTAATTMASSKSGLKIRIKRLAAKEYGKYAEVLTGAVFALVCIILCSFGRVNLHGMNEEETIRQYVYYSNADYQEGMKQLALYDEWDYLFPNKLAGRILDIQRGDAKGKVSGSNGNVYQIRMEAEYDGAMEYENYSILLVKDTLTNDWKIDYRTK